MSTTNQEISLEVAEKNETVTVAIKTPSLAEPLPPQQTTTAYKLQPHRAGIGFASLPARLSLQGKEWGKKCFSSLFVGWRVGCFFVDRAMAQSGEDGCFDLLVVDRKGCRVLGIAKHGLWGRVVGCRRWAAL